jgi:hypothetical protein
MDRWEFEVGDFGGRRWLVEVRPGVVRVRMSVPTALPEFPVFVLFDVVKVNLGFSGWRYSRPEEALQNLDTDIQALTVLSSGNPRHPLYRSRDLEPTPYEYDD